MNLFSSTITQSPDIISAVVGAGSLQTINVKTVDRTSTDDTKPALANRQPTTFRIISLSTDARAGFKSISNHSSTFSSIGIVNEPAPTDVTYNEHLLSGGNNA